MSTAEILEHAVGFCPRPPARIQVVAPEGDADGAIRALIDAGCTAESLEPGAWLDASTPAGELDAIVFLGCLSEITDPSAAFRAARRLLKPDSGRVIVCDAASGDEANRRIGGHAHRDLVDAWSASGLFVRRERESRPGRRNRLSDVERDGSPAGWTRLTPPPVTEPDGVRAWDLRPGPCVIRGYEPGDEAAILRIFQDVFGEARSEAHFRWKFLECPFGGPYIANAWDGDRIVAHYSALPVPLWMNGRYYVVHHIGDTMTLPSHRGVGRGKTSLLVRVFLHTLWTEIVGRVPFAFGYTNATHQRFGQLFMGYEIPEAVWVRVLNDDALDAIRGCAKWQSLLRGYTVRRTRTVGDWADRIFRSAREHYGWQVARTSEYLRWRYERHPDHEYEFFVVSRWGVPCGWWLGRVEGDTLLLGDALFIPSHRGPRAGLAALLQALAAEGRDIREVRGWFSLTPAWWNGVLDWLGFEKEREPTELALVVGSMVEGVDLDDLRQHFYFTQGDGDMF